MLKIPLHVYNMEQVQRSAAWAAAVQSLVSTAELTSALQERLGVSASAATAEAVALVATSAQAESEGCLLASAAMAGASALVAQHILQRM